MTLIEILASMVILSIIIISFLSLFIQSSKSNQVAQKIIDTTYIAETAMEEMYGIIRSNNTLATLPIPTGYSRSVNDQTRVVYVKYVSTHYVEVELTSAVNDPLVRVKVKVYNDNKKTKLEAQMEMLLNWKSSG